MSVAVLLNACVCGCVSVCSRALRDRGRGLVVLIRLRLSPVISARLGRSARLSEFRGVQRFGGAWCRAEVVDQGATLYANDAAERGVAAAMPLL